MLGRRLPSAASGRLRSDGFLDPIGGRGRENTFGRSSWRRTQVLPEPGRDQPECLRSTEWPVGIAQHLAREQHQIGLIIADDLVGLSRRGDQADRSGGDIGFASNPFREGRLIPRPHRDIRLFEITPRGIVSGSRTNRHKRRHGDC
jgi:hypothetical protein